MPTDTAPAKDAPVKAARPSRVILDATQPAPPDEPDLWALLAAPFPADAISLLPKAMKRQDTDKGPCGGRYSADGENCGGHHARSIHLSYVGHADVTMRLNDVDPTWHWEPMALTASGTPQWADGGLWITLTVLGVTRLGFGDAGAKSGPDAVKEVIGDAIRNAAMRFGVATYLWSKSERAKAMAAGETEPEPAPPARTAEPVAAPTTTLGGERALAVYAAITEAQRVALRQYTVDEGIPDVRYLTDAQATKMEDWATATIAHDAAEAASVGTPGYNGDPVQGRDEDPS